MLMGFKNNKETKKKKTQLMILIPSAKLLVFLLFFNSEINYGELTFRKAFFPYFVLLFNLCDVVYKILCWINISKFYVAKIKVSSHGTNKTNNNKYLI